MILVRLCEGLDELEACVRLQIATWGYDETDIMPRKAFKVAQKIGGQVFGAFDTSLAGASPQGDPACLVGFAYSLPGIKTDRGAPAAYLHSHMLAVREGYANRGIGAQLKLEQRREALARKIRLMEWTFDPLEIRNAHLNISKLGVIVRSYLVDFYGVSSSRLQGGLPTDRLIAEWHLDSPRVRAILEGRPRPSCKIEERIRVPAAIYEWKASAASRTRASAVQLENRHKFQDAFGRGLAVLGFVLDEKRNGIFELGSPEQAELT